MQVNVTDPDWTAHLRRSIWVNDSQYHFYKALIKKRQTG